MPQDPAFAPPKKKGFFESLFGKTPKPRLPPSGADPSALTGVPLSTEEDVLHIRHLPDFGGYIRAADSEVLLQVPPTSSAPRRNRSQTACHRRNRVSPP